MRLAATTAVVLVAVAALTAQPRALGPADIDAAIALGERGEPRPYLLRHQGQPNNPVVVGAVYTPFLRIAFLSRAAHDRGERLDPASIEASVVAPLVYVAFRWYCCDNDSTGALAAAEPQVLMLPVAPRAPQFVKFMDRRAGAAPIWSRKGSAVLESFAAPVPYDDIVLVAAFPSDVLQAGRPFVIYKDAVVIQSIRTGVVRADDALAWR
jgi:hypothetical protein